jgi:hypothetical protein
VVWQNVSTGQRCDTRIHENYRPCKCQAARVCRPATGSRCCGLQVRTSVYQSISSPTSQVYSTLFTSSRCCTSTIRTHRAALPASRVMKVLPIDGAGSSVSLRGGFVLGHARQTRSTRITAAVVNELSGEGGSPHPSAPSGVEPVTLALSRRVHPRASVCERHRRATRRPLCEGRSCSGSLRRPSAAHCGSRR